MMLVSRCIFFFLRRIKDRSLIQMYWSGTKEDSEVIQEITEEGSKICIVCCTTAFGLGVNILDIDFVILYGCPRNRIDLWQQAGRCARNGQRGVVFMYKVNLRVCEDAVMKDLYKKPSKCIRKAILSEFVFSPQVTLNDLAPQSDTPVKCGRNGCKPFCWCHKCSCCSFCKQTCCCKGRLSDLQLFTEVLCTDM